jgi:hypothetical protein
MPTPLPVISDGFRVAHVMHSNDATFANVFWFITDGTVNDGDVAAGFMDAYFDISSGPTIASLQSQDLTMDGVEVIALDGISESHFFPYATTKHGLVLSQAAAANACLVLTWLTGVRGRSHRGRTFLPGCPNASLESGSGRWSSALITDAATWIQTWFDNLAGEPGNLLLAQVSQRAVDSPHHAAVTGFIPRQGIGTQRRRTERQKP